MQWLPGLRFVLQDVEFDGIASIVLFEEGVDAGAVCREDAKGLFGYLRPQAVGDAVDADGAHETVDRNGFGAEHLGQAPLPEAAQEIHLPEAVLRMHVSCRDVRVILRGGKDVWKSGRVAVDVYRVRETHDIAASLDVGQ